MLKDISVSLFTPEFSAIDNIMLPALKLGKKSKEEIRARALINESVIIMCDEPSGNLDLKNTEIVFDIFRKLCHENWLTIIAVTHDDDFAVNSDRIIELQVGVLLKHEY